MGKVSTLGRRRKLLVATVLFTLAIALGSFLYLSSQMFNMENLESIRIGLAGNEVDSLIYIAENQRFFASNGINLTIKGYISGLASVDGMLNGEVDIAAEAEFVLVPEILANENIRLFGTIDKFDNSYIAARTDKGINLISDLKGRRIGVALGTSVEFYLGRFLELNGLDISQVTLVDVPPPQTPNVLANGTADAVITWQPHISTIKNLIGDKTAIWPAQENQLQYRTLVCMADWAATHPELITRFLNSLAQAEKYLINKPEESKAIIQNRLNYSVDYIDEVWPKNHFSLSLDQSLIAAMQDETQWLIDNDLTDAISVPNFLDYMYLDGLQSVKPESVNIIG